jgi:hypothetical protein
MMDDDQTKFWGILIMVAVGVAAAVLLIDLSIKAAILDESNALKKEILYARRRPAEADTDGTNHYRTNNGRDAGDDVLPFPTRMEAPTVRAGYSRQTGPAAMAGTIEHSERNGDGSVAADDKPVDS